MLRTERLSKEYVRGRPALDHLDLEVGSGEIYCLLGANGAGKTTAIHLFLDFIKPTSGNAFINGIGVSREPLKAKAHVAYLPENVRLHGSFTACQNLDVFARFGGKYGLQRQQYYDGMRQVGLPENSFDRPVHEFSKGMRQKLGLAICIIKHSPALILDEPMAGLDPQAAWDMMGILKSLSERGTAILMSTHDVFRAKELADRVGILKEGVKLTEMTREEIAGQNLEELYLRYINRPSGESGRRARNAAAVTDGRVG